MTGKSQAREKGPQRLFELAGLFEPGQMACPRHEDELCRGETLG